MISKVFILHVERLEVWIFSYLCNRYCRNCRVKNAFNESYLLEVLLMHKCRSLGIQNKFYSCPIFLYGNTTKEMSPITVAFCWEVITVDLSTPSIVFQLQQSWMFTGSRWLQKAIYEDNTRINYASGVLTSPPIHRLGSVPPLLFGSRLVDARMVGMVHISSRYSLCDSNC